MRLETLPGGGWACLVYLKFLMHTKTSPETLVFPFPHSLTRFQETDPSNSLNATTTQQPQPSALTPWQRAQGIRMSTTEVVANAIVPTMVSYCQDPCVRTVEDNQLGEIPQCNFTPHPGVRCEVRPGPAPGARYVLCLYRDKGLGTRACRQNAAPATPASLFHAFRATCQRRR